MEFKIEGLSKTIGKDVILNELDVRLKEGDVLVFIFLLVQSEAARQPF